VIQQTNALRAVVDPFRTLELGVEDVRTLLELCEEGSEDDRRSLGADIAAELEKLQAISHRLEFQSLLGDELDPNNAYLTLHAGAGGTESCDWADMLFRMYSRYAEQHDFEFSVLDSTPGDEAGLKSVSVLVSGAYAYGYLKAERGVHRLVRISPFDANKRRHTSFAALDVVAEIDDDVEVELIDSDLKVDTFRASGAGGQHVNTTDSAVRITHLPSGLVVQCQAERSQHANRNKAMKLLRARLYEMVQDQQRQDMEQFYGNKGEIAWGSQIRSYVLQPYTLVKDHRTGVEVGNVQGVLDGCLDEFIEGYLKKRSHEHSA